MIHLTPAMAEDIEINGEVLALDINDHGGAFPGDALASGQRLVGVSGHKQGSSPAAGPRSWHSLRS